MKELNKQQKSDPYLVSARKYRPLSFEEVVGQKIITDTLSQSLKENKIAQSILFSGPKGVGKTTCARILAKKLNEAYLSDSDDLSFNVFELDGASHNSVEDIRNLAQQIRFAPQRGKYKVYIIDEVHMLSQSAFNAFLKTLEEPPSYVVFILATTEKHKVIPTILSRCQIYEFRSISSEAIALYLEKISQKEAIKISQEALLLIASQGEGSMRGVLFLFDRIKVLSQEGREISKEIVESHLGIISLEVYFELLEKLRVREIFSVFLHFDKILSKGFNIDLFLSGFSSYLRNILLLKNEKTIQLVDFEEKIQEKCLQQATSTDLNFLIFSLKTTKKAEIDLRLSKNKRLSIEITLMELASFCGENPEKESFFLDSQEKNPSQKNVFHIKEASQNEAVSPEIKSEILLNPKTHPTQEVREDSKEIYVKENPSKDKKALSGFFSIKEALEEIQENQKKEIIEEKLSKHFSKEEFEGAWNLFLEKENLGKKKIPLAIFKNINFELKENHQVILYFDSFAAKAQFEALEEKITGFLREKLANFLIKLTPEIIKNLGDEKSFYGAKDRYEFLTQKNSFLKKLIKTFHLDYI